MRTYGPTLEVNFYPANMRIPFIVCSEWTDWELTRCQGLTNPFKKAVLATTSGREVMT
jgi:hypothetical protein